MSVSTSIFGLFIGNTPAGPKAVEQYFGRPLLSAIAAKRNGRIHYTTGCRTWATDEPKKSDPVLRECCHPGGNRSVGMVFNYNVSRKGISPSTNTSSRRTTGTRFISVRGINDLLAASDRQSVNFNKFVLWMRTISARARSDYNSGVIV